MRDRQRIGAVSCVFGVIALLTACESSSSMNSTPVSTKQNVADWAMPLDPYTDDQKVNEEYAENLLVGSCMDKRGAEWPVAHQPVEDDGNGTSNPSGRTLFNVDIARKYGYHQANNLDKPGFEEARRIIDSGRQLTSTEQAAFDTCLSEARQTLGTEESLPQLAASYGADPYEETKASAPVNAAARRWARCMAPQGISDLGSNPVDMPSASVARMFGLDGDGDASSRPSKAEIELAVADAGCQATSGYEKAFYDGEWNRQSKVVAENADSLNRLRTQIMAKQTRVLAVIAEHAPQG